MQDPFLEDLNLSTGGVQFTLPGFRLSGDAWELFWEIDFLACVLPTLAWQKQKHFHFSVSLVS